MFVTPWAVGLALHDIGLTYDADIYNDGLGEDFAHFVIGFVTLVTMACIVALYLVVMEMIRE